MTGRGRVEKTACFQKRSRNAGMMKTGFSMPAVLLAVGSLLLLCTVSQAVPQDAGLPGAYLGFAGGARAGAMGRSFVAVADGADCVVWNPAGLGYLRPNTVSLTHAGTVEQTSLDTLLYAQPLFLRGGFGLGYVRMDSGSLPLTDELNRRMGSFNDLQQTYLLSYGMPVYSARSAGRFLQTVSAGATFKFSKQDLYDTRASGWGMDLGVLAKFRRNITAGIKLQNAVAPRLKYETSTDIFQRLLTVGVAVGFLKNNLSVASDLEKAIGVEQRLRWSLGVEGIMWNVIKLRGGFDLKNKEFAFGFGYVFGRHEIAYAASTNDMGLSHNLGLVYSFGGFPVTIQANPQSFSPVGLRKSTTFGIMVKNSQRLYGWTLDIKNQDGVVVRVFRGSGTPPPELSWDGSTQKGLMVAAGNYIYTLQVTDAEGKKEMTMPQVVRIEYGTPLDMLEMRTR